MVFLDAKLPQLRALCRQHRVKTMHVFGSVLTARFGPESDIDLLVEFLPGMGPMDYGENYLRLAAALRDLCGREVDLVEGDAIRNPFFRMSVDRSKRLIYG